MFGSDRGARHLQLSGDPRRRPTLPLKSLDLAASLAEKTHGNSVGAGAAVLKPRLSLGLPAIHPHVDGGGTHSHRLGHVLDHPPDCTRTIRARPAGVSFAFLWTFTRVSDGGAVGDLAITSASLVGAP